MTPTSTWTSLWQHPTWEQRTTTFPPQTDIRWGTCFVDHGLDLSLSEGGKKQSAHSWTLTAQSYLGKVFLPSVKTKMYLSLSNPEQTDSWQDHSCHCHYHSCSGGPGVPGAHQDCPRSQEAGVIQEWLHELGPAFLCLLWTNCCSQTQGRHLLVLTSFRYRLCFFKCHFKSITIHSHQMFFFFLTPMMIQPC